MMPGWRRRLGSQALRGKTWAALTSTAKSKPPLRRGEGGGPCSVQGRASEVCGGRANERQRDGALWLAKHAAVLRTVSYPDFNSRLFSSNARNGDGAEREGQAGSSVPSAQLRGDRRRRAWEKSLSPLERVSRLVPEEFLSEEINAMRGPKAEESTPRSQESSLFSGCVPLAPSHPDQDTARKRLLCTAPQNIPFQVGELILAEFRPRRHSVCRKMCKLIPGGMLNSSWGTIPFVKIIGKLPGQLLLTSIGKTSLIRRPTLEDYVLMMKRGPAISYPKDVNTMLLLMDINQGDVVLEAGSGSGAMSLFLSRAVGPFGRVTSYEVRKDHHHVAKTNYQKWRAAWEIGHPVEWPDNVEFINEDISAAAEGLKTETFDAVALDMVMPEKVLPVIVPILKQGGVCAVYLANITQVIELLEAIQTTKSTLLCERVIEVTHRDWLIQPVLWKNCKTFYHMKSRENMDDESTWHAENYEQPAEQSDDNAVFVSDKARVPYICRPHHLQLGYTVFLVKLRKFNPANPDSAPDDDYQDCHSPDLH